MKILVVSDTHGNEFKLLQAHQAAGQVDAVIHLGDGEADTAILETIETCPVIKVAGNCDLGSSAPRELILEWHQKRILICHGDCYGVKTGLSRLIDHAEAEEIDVVLYGHTHVANQLQHETVLVLNPGTLWGRAPFLSYAILTVEADQVSAEIYKLPE